MRIPPNPPAAVPHGRRRGAAPGRWPRAKDDRRELPSRRSSTARCRPGENPGHADGAGNVGSRSSSTSSTCPSSPSAPRRRTSSSGTRPGPSSGALRRSTPAMRRAVRASSGIPRQQGPRASRTCICPRVAEAARSVSTSFRPPTCGTPPAPAPPRPERRDLQRATLDRRAQRVRLDAVVRRLELIGGFCPGVGLLLMLAGSMQLALRVGLRSLDRLTGQVRALGVSFSEYANRGAGRRRRWNRGRGIHSRSMRSWPLGGQFRGSVGDCPATSPMNSRPRSPSSAT